MHSLIPTHWPRLPLFGDVFAADLPSVFEGVFPARPATDSSAFVPAIDAWSDADALHLLLDVPGFGIEDIELSVHEGRLSIRGERKVELAEGLQFHRRERAQGRFERVLKLPFEVDAEQVRAELKQGVLAVRLPKVEAAKPQRIQVTAAG
jgi:HSP20 family protein